MHLPSSEKLWQMPHPPTVFPTPPEALRRTVPLEEHDTSYLADSASTLSLCKTCSFICISLLFSQLYKYGKSRHPVRAVQIFTDFL
ncbi:unknown [Bacteroides sp. CAG:443]|nr:unknown [Bacteroides sp. CAG:443]